jgi:hypothetical protein
MLPESRPDPVPDDVTRSRHRIAIASGVALFVAGLVLVFFVLPAEFAVDPIGVGARTGLLDLGVTGQQVAALDAAASRSGQAGETRIIAADEKPVRHESVTFALKPREGMEYKYRLAKGQVLVFTWAASAPVNFEAHAEPDGAPRGYAQTYEKGTQGSASGTLTAPFSGIHGWFWENTTAQPATVTIEAAGFYTLSHEFRANEAVKTKTYR